MSKTYLKVKIKSLAAEARIIRKEEHKAKAHYRYLKNKQGHEDQYNRAQSTWYGLQQHRKIDVRQEARASLLAYAFIRNKPFVFAEPNTDRFANDGSFKYELACLTGRIAKMATKYGDKKVESEDIKKWILNE